MHTQYGFAEAENPFDTAYMPVELVSKVLSKLVPQKRMARVGKIWEEHGDVFGGQDEVCCVGGSYCVCARAV